ncbi:hypothetical protein EON65_49595 [archaeon]|nr:MAG: hypothetical protein EON65_49595 [archaeon]
MGNLKEFRPKELHKDKQLCALGIESLSQTSEARILVSSRMTVHVFGDNVIPEQLGGEVKVAPEGTAFKVDGHEMHMTHCGNTPGLGEFHVVSECGQ